MRTLKEKSKIAMFEHMKDRVKESVCLPSFINDIEESESSAMNIIV